MLSDSKSQPSLILSSDNCEVLNMKDSDPNHPDAPPCSHESDCHGDKCKKDPKELFNKNLRKNTLNYPFKLITGLAPNCGYQF